MDVQAGGRPAIERHGQTILRISVALVLLATALGKSLDSSGFADVVGTYQVLPQWSWYPAGLLLIVVEWGVGLWLLSGRATARAALAAGFLHTIFTGWAALALVRGLEIANCGCFGVFYARPLTLSTVFEDVIMIVLCLTIYGLDTRHQPTTQLSKTPGPSKGGDATL